MEKKVELKIQYFHKIVISNFIMIIKLMNF